MNNDINEDADFDNIPEGIFPNDIFESEVDFLLFCVEEDKIREDSKKLKPSDCIFKTYIESRQDYNKIIKSRGEGEPDVPVLYGYDVYVNVDSLYFNLGIFPTIKEARRAENSIKLRLERELKNFVKSSLSGLNKNG